MMKCLNTNLKYFDLKVSLDQYKDLCLISLREIISKLFKIFMDIYDGRLTKTQFFISCLNLHYSLLFLM